MLLHRLLREAVTNCLVHADYYGRQGIVVSKNSDGFVFANPGGMRIPTSEALAGGVSDPRNATLLKMFSFIRFGERAGSGLNGIVYVWEKVFHTAPEIFVKHEYDRTFLKLPTLGKEPDMEAMAEFYPDEEASDNQETSDKPSDNQATNIDIVDKQSINDPINGTLNGNDPINGTISDPLNENNLTNVRINDPINENNLTNVRLIGTINGNNLTNVRINDPINENEKVDDTIIIQMICLIRDNPYINAIQLSELLNKSERHIRRLLAKLLSDGSIRRVGARKNGHWEVINNQSDT